MKTKPIRVPDHEHRSKTIPACHRCGQNPGEHRWVAASRSAERVFAELRICAGCLSAFQGCIADGKDRGVPPASAGPVVGRDGRLLYRTIEIPIRQRA